MGRSYVRRHQLGDWDELWLGHYYSLDCEHKQHRDYLYVVSGDQFGLQRFAERCADRALEQPYQPDDAQPVQWRDLLRRDVDTNDTSPASSNTQQSLQMPNTCITSFAMDQVLRDATNPNPSLATQWVPWININGSYTRPSRRSAL